MNLKELIETYITYRQTLGAKFYGTGTILRAFARFVGEEINIYEVTAQRVAVYLAGDGPVTHFWINKYRALSGFYDFAKSRGHVTEIPLPSAIPKLPSFVPYVYSHEELTRLIEATSSYQRGKSSLSPSAFRTILLLLYGTGLRDGEALRLNRADVDLANSLLVVRKTKFHKSRLVPFGAQIRQVLADYTKERVATVNDEDENAPFFTTLNGTRVVLNTLEAHFRRIRKHAGIQRTDGASYQPRLHDLRHTFAVHRVTSWYQQEADVQKLVFQLSVYLGHAHLSDTQVYLSMTADLLQKANARFEDYVENGGQS